MSFQYLVGAEIDYKDDLEGAQFVIRNPNAVSTCGCGSSFSACFQPCSVIGPSGRLSGGVVGAQTTGLTLTADAGQAGRLTQSMCPGQPRKGRSLPHLLRPPPPHGK